MQDCDQSYASKVLHLLPTFFIFHDKISFNKNYSKFLNLQLNFKLQLNDIKILKYFNVI